MSFAVSLHQERVVRASARALGPIRKLMSSQRAAECRIVSSEIDISRTFLTGLDRVHGCQYEPMTWDESFRAISHQFGISPQKGYKWLARFEEGELEGLVAGN